MKILIVKLSSLGDVVHAMPAVRDIRRMLPDARIEWVVERAFGRLVAHNDSLDRIVPCDLRKWSKSPLSKQTRAEWRHFRSVLREEAYDAIIDLQGLTKSALVARAARLAPGGKRYAMANRTEGSSYEAPTRWVADEAIRIEPHVHAIARSRELCARALGYRVPERLDFGLVAQDPVRPMEPPGQRWIAFVHGTSRADKCWPEEHWVALGERLIREGFTIGLPQGGDAERERAQRIAHALAPQAHVWPSLDLGALTDWLGACEGVIGVDSGLSHIATALDLPHVQIYNFDTAWRTGPDGGRQRSVFAQPTPSVDAVWEAWQEVRDMRDVRVPG